ncbi:MAG: tryptophan--tRNA ligase [Candidatus Micrarchaeota archaeon]
MEVDPWGSELVDYSKLFSEFGMQRMDEGGVEKASRVLRESRLFRRGIIFAHRDFGKFTSDWEAGKPVAVMSGIKPSGEFHLGSKLTADELVFMQKSFGAKVFYSIADLESYADNGLWLSEGHKNAVMNVSDLLALGLDPKNAYVYKQSEEKRVLRLGNLFAKKTTMATLKAIYGERGMGIYSSVLVQAGDILLPQLPEFGGPKSVVVPVGADQDPHIRFTRDIAQKFTEEYGFRVPCATFHKFFRSLNGEMKMSKRDPMNIMTLSDDEAILKKKIANALTGGRATAEEQKKHGGEIGKCVIYELMLFHFYEDDAELKKMHDDCTGGRILCGECKKMRLEAIVRWLRAHKEKKKKNIPRAEKILSEGQ